MLRPNRPRLIALMRISSDLWIKFSKMQILGSCRTRKVADARRKRTQHDDFREIRFYKRGRHVEQFEVVEWFGLRQREVEIEVFDDLVLVVAMKTQTEIGSRRELLEAPQDHPRIGTAEVLPQYRVRRSICSFSQCARRYEQFR